MHTKRFWGPAFQQGDRRARRRMAAGFYAIELAEDGGRYLRRVANLSNDGLLLESPLGDERPGQVVELELPRLRPERPMRVRTEVVRVTAEGKVAVKRLAATDPLPVESLGGRESL
jgi:hypothetical protein